MKLSEAIRAGAKLRPQGFEDFFTMTAKPKNDVDDSVFASCALGAAYEAVEGRILPTLSGRSVIGLFQEKMGIDLNTCEFEHPFSYMPLFNTIVHLNDVHQWTREKIADWVESIGF